MRISVYWSDIWHQNIPLTQWEWYVESAKIHWHFIVLGEYYILKYSPNTTRHIRGRCVDCVRCVQGINPILTWWVKKGYPSKIILCFMHFGNYSKNWAENLSSFLIFFINCGNIFRVFYLQIGWFLSCFCLTCNDALYKKSSLSKANVHLIKSNAKKENLYDINFYFSNVWNHLRGKSLDETHRLTVKGGRAFNWIKLGLNWNSKGPVVA